MNLKLDQAINHLLHLLNTTMGALALVLMLHSPLSAGQSVTPMPDSWGRTIGFLDFSQPDMTETEILLNARNYSFVFGGLLSQLGMFRATNPDINIARYMVGFLDDHNARPDSYPGGRSEDTPERRARTLLWWNTEVDGVGHPDWILYRCDGVTPAYWLYDDGSTLPSMPLDISNPNVADWLLRNSEEPGFSTLFADLVYLENYTLACGIWRNGEWVQLFTGEPVDPAFSSAVLDWARRLSAGLHSRPSPRGFVPNCPLYPSYRDDAIAELIANVDGLLDEEGFTAYGSKRIYLSENVWLNKIRNMVAVQNQGVPFYSMNYVATFPPSQDEVEWVLGSFLMGREHSAYLLMTLSPELGDYGPHWPHLPQYDEDIGHPCGAMTSTQNVYVRDFSKGMAVVNPSGDTRYTFQVPEGNFRDVYGNPIGSVLVLEPVTGKVLLTDSERCP